MLHNLFYLILIIVLYGNGRWIKKYEIQKLARRQGRRGAVTQFRTIVK